MLSLQSATPVTWVRRVEEHLDEVLVDHAHCEKKAAGVGMSMIFAYVTHEPMVAALSEVVQEELQHLQQVLKILAARGLSLRSQTQSSYGKRLSALIRRKEPEKAVDRCLVAALIEARSCERFQLLAEHLRDQDLASFYATLLASEARHHALFVRLAALHAPEDAVRGRLHELAREEAALLARGDPFVRLHS